MHRYYHLYRTPNDSAEHDRKREHLMFDAAAFLNEQPASPTIATAACNAEPDESAPSAFPTNDSESIDGFRVNVQ